ncbi:MAG: restriction endonuclease subunit S, partial [Cyanobacteria bacterium REEB459]|nr:restriction endonuclease subunit S [Cyanobacteria bacterium REEB459]
MSELPKGWAEATLERLCSFNPRHDSLIDRQIEISFVPMPAVCDQEGIILPHENRFLEEIWKGYTHFQDNDVIFAKITPCMENGKIALASGLRNGLACGSTEFHVLRSLGVVLPEYLWRFIRQLDFRKEAERHMTGAVGQRRVPVQFLKETTIPFPPLNEQRRLVAKLDSLFTRSRRAREELGRVPGLVQRYKQAVLAAAFRGDLTADWRKENYSDLL